MESITSMTYEPTPVAVARCAAWTRQATSPVTEAYEGTTVSALASAATTARTRKTDLLPISGVVVFDGPAGIRSWGPPV